MRTSLIISFLICALSGGLNTIRNTPIMVINKTQAEANPSNANTNQSSDVQGASADSPEITAAKEKVRAAEKWTDIANKLTVIFGIAYLVATVLIVASTPFTLWANKQLRSAEGVLNELLMAKIRADAARKTEVDTERVRQEAAANLERVRGESESRVFEARAEAARQVGEVQERATNLERLANEARTELAIQQARAAEAEKALEEVKRRQQPRKFFPSRAVQDSLANNPKGEVVEILYPKDDGEGQSLARDIESTLRWAKWRVGDLRAYEGVGEEAFGDDVTIVAQTFKAFLFAKDEAPLLTLAAALESVHLRLGRGSDLTLPSIDSFRLVISKK